MFFSRFVAMDILNVSSYSIGIVIHVVFTGYLTEMVTQTLFRSNVKRFYFYRTVLVCPLSYIGHKNSKQIFFCVCFKQCISGEIFGKWKGMRCWKTYAYMLCAPAYNFTLRQLKNRWCCIHWYKWSTCIWRMCTQFLWPFEIFIGQVEIYMCNGNK